MKLFTKAIDDKLFKQYPMGSDLEKQMVVTKIFNPYGNTRWYLLNSDPEDPDYLWAIVQMNDIIEVGSVSRSELERIRVKPWGLPLERDLSFIMVNAKELYDGLREGKFYKRGGWVENDENKDMLLNYAEEFEHHTEEFEEAAKKAKHVPAWVVAKSERASTDLSDVTHYLDSENERAREEMEGEEMAKGGELKKIDKLKRGDYFIVLKDMGDIKRFRIWKIEGNYVTINYSKNDGTNVFDTNETKSNLMYLLDNGYIKKVSKDEYWKRKYDNYAEGGEMEKGGITGDLHSLTDKMLSKKIITFLAEVKPIKYYYIDEENNMLVVGFDQYYTQDAGDKFYKAATPDFFDLSSVYMEYDSKTKDTKYFIKLKRDAKFKSGGQMAKGGKTTFSEKVSAVKESLLERKKVAPKVQKDYGKTYSPKEAEESAKRIVGAMTARERLMNKIKDKRRKNK